MIETTTNLTVVQCGACGVLHAIPCFMYEHCEESGGFWTCPNGHRWGFAIGARKQRLVAIDRDRLAAENALLQKQIKEMAKKVAKNENAEPVKLLEAPQ